jgi:hypothetical protein
METANISSSSADRAAEWGPFVPGPPVNSITELQPGDLVLERTRKLGFSEPCLHVVEILGGDPSGGNRPLVRARMLEPADPARRRRDTPAWFVLWNFYLREGRTEIFRAVRA